MKAEDDKHRRLPSEKGQPSDIRERTFAFALRAVKLFQFLQSRRDGAALILGKQYLRSSTSIGANVEEARSGESRADFIHKMGIAQKEARESPYWLRLLAASGLVGEKRIEPLMQETGEIIAVVTSIIVTSKRKTKGNVNPRPARAGRLMASSLARQNFILQHS
ncbi:MAG TPA: four helix bundle protein [Terriglobia bacterium]|nr:four helix bundle protein [Terriglobia bacterium]